MSSAIVQSLREILTDSSRITGTVVKVSASGAVTVRTSKGLVNALPPPGAVVTEGSSVVVDGGNIYFGLSSKRPPKIYRV